MQQIAEWLDQLGMSEYAQRFAENDIDFAILSDLTDQDLEKIGIASLGHGRKLLRAIAGLETDKTVSAAGITTPTEPSKPQMHRTIAAAAELIARRRARVTALVFLLSMLPLRYDSASRQNA